MSVPVNESGSRKMTDNTCRAVRVESVGEVDVVAMVMGLCGLRSMVYRPSSQTNARIDPRLQDVHDQVNEDITRRAK